MSPGSPSTVAGAGLRVLHVGGEVAPYSKTGGLGDVLGALPAALRAVGVEASVLAPMYGGIDRSGLLLDETIEVKVGPQGYRAQLFRAPGGHVRLVDIPGLLDRPEPYGDYPDNPLRFAAFCKVAAALAPRFDVCHLHDWHAALTAMYVRAPGRPPTVPCVQSIHNLAYQGLCDPSWADPLEIPEALRGFDGLEFHGGLSLLKAGLVLAERLTTVSPRYAQEIQSEPGGQRLSGLLSERSAVLSGILNGVDTTAFDPMTDPALPFPFDASTLGRRRGNRTALLTEMGLTDAGGPVFGIVSRATWQKGLDLVAEVLPSERLVRSRFLLLADGDHDIIARFRGLARAFPDRLAVRMGFDAALSRRIYGGADFVLVPSRFEPCGLSQMYAMRYGAVPLVRETGGLADTVTDGETGLTFFDPHPGALHEALLRAIALFEAPEALNALRGRAMAAEHGWAVPARAYADVYSSLHADANRGTP